MGDRRCPCVCVCVRRANFRQCLIYFINDSDYHLMNVTGLLNLLYGTLCTTLNNFMTFSYDEPRADGVLCDRTLGCHNVDARIFFSFLFFLFDYDLFVVFSSFLFFFSLSPLIFFSLF